MNARFKVTIKGRKRYFATLESARVFCAEVFAQTGIVLGIEAAE